MRKVLLYLLVGTFGLIMGLTLCSAEEVTLDSINVSVDFKSDTDLKYALQIISVLTGVSIISDNDVTGKVTARFIDQPLLDVLERILEVNDCEYKLVDNVIMVRRIPVMSRIFPLKFALASDMEKIIKTYLSPEGIIQVNEERNELTITDTSYYLEKIEKELGKMDNLEDWLVTKKYFLTYLTPEEARPLLQVLITDYGEIRLPRMRRGEEQSQEKEEYILIPQEESSEREAVRERPLDKELTELRSERVASLEEGEGEGNVIYVTDLKRNIGKIDELIAYLNGAETASQIITKTFYIQEGSLERMALAMANILGINPDDIEGLGPEREWMEMKVQTLEIELGTVGPK